MIFVNDEPQPRAAYYPLDQGSWEQFAWSEPIALGVVKGEVTSIQFSTAGQQYGTADLDQFILTTRPGEDP